MAKIFEFPRAAKKLETEEVNAVGSSNMGNMDNVVSIFGENKVDKKDDFMLQEKKQQCASG